MSNAFKYFIVKVFIAIFILLLSGWIVFSFFLPDKYSPILPWMLTFFSLFTIGIHGYQLRLAQKDMARFVRISMIISMIRLLVYSLFAIVYLSLAPDNIPVFIVCLVVVYLVFLVLEVADLSRFSKKQQKK
ncbi:MAG: hypothetical protein WCY58_09660 [Mariniphaga sp.]|nr:hypothetical protein [Mariniphaga sp.]MDD4225102.1 hypothetical protein [Mariniphaga sp.]MDD4424442.1 hypothetical protein [Mariniphaga sp.]